MDQRRRPLFSLLGFGISVDPSWFVILLLVTGSLATGAFPARFPQLAPAWHLLMGLTAALLLFASIVFHELGHALVARLHRLPVGGITLFMFGGVAELRGEPERPRAELLTALAGPAVSILLALGLGAVTRWGEGAGWPQPPLAILGYLALINGILAAFNLLPAFPLDGGRVLRAVLWAWRKDLRWATRMAAQAGRVVAVLMIAWGGLNALLGATVNGLWLVLVGMFLFGAARSALARARHLPGREPDPGAPTGTGGR